MAAGTSTNGRRGWSFRARSSKGAPGSTPASTRSTTWTAYTGCRTAQTAPAASRPATFLYNLADTNRYGLSILNPVETTTNIRQTTYMSTIRDQHYFGGALLDI